MKLKQKELKKTMRGIFAGACLLAIGSAVVFAVGTETEMKAYAAEWQQAENGDWTYAEDDGSYATGWQKIGGVWYYLDPESGVWNSHPALDQTSVCYLLENAVNKKGWFNREISEDEILHYNVDSSSQYKYTVVIQKEDRPDEIGSTLKTFEVDKRTGTAKDVSTKIILNLYE